MNQKPWLREDGTIKSTEELKKCSQNWKPSVWEAYLDDLSKKQMNILLWDDQKIQKITNEYYKKAIKDASKPSEFKHLQGYIKDALDVLNPTQRHIVTEVYWNNKPYSEIAKELNIGKSTVQSYLSRALKKLKKAMLSIHNNNDQQNGLGIEKILKTSNTDRTARNISQY